MRRLVFIEGVSGTGKSTTAAGLAGLLSASGRAAACHLEGDFDSPLDIHSSAYVSRAEYQGLLSRYPQAAGTLAAHSRVEHDYAIVQYRTAHGPLYNTELYTLLKRREFCYYPEAPVPFSEYQRVFYAQWRRFAGSRDAQTACHVFDGSLLQHQINDMLRNYSLCEDAIIDHLARLLQIARPLRPILFYLSSGDVGERLREARAARGQREATAQDIAFWEERKRLDLLAIGRLDIEAHVFDVSGGRWPEAIHAMAGLLV